MRFLIFIYGEKYGKRFLLSEDANQKCRIILTKDEFSIEQTMFLELEYIMQEWYIKETAYYKVSKKQFFQTEKVEENQAAFYKLNTGRKYILKIGEKNISIQCIYCKYDWSTYRTYRLKVCRIIKQSNKVFLTGDDSEQIPCVNILNKNGQWFLNNYGIEPVYINGDFIKENKKLSYGDIIYFFGRIFLFFDDFIAVEQTEEEMNVFCLEEIKVNEFIQDKGIIAPMLKESFHRAPRIMEHLEKLTLQIENPPILGMFGMEEQRSVFMDIGAVLSMMFPMLGMNVFLIYGMRTEGNQAGTYVYSGIFMVVMSVMCSLLWIMISRQYEKRQRKERADRKKNAYRRYLNKKSMQIKEQYEKTYKVLQSRYLCADRYVDNSLLFLYLWNRNPYHEDFLKYRVGTGNMRFPMEIKFVGEVSYEEEGILWQEAEKIREHYNIMHQIPMLLDITQYNQVGVIEAEMDDGMLIVRNLILQIVLCNCYTEVKLACIYDKNKVMQYEQWGFCRWLPHIWDSDRRKRNIAENLSEARELFYRLLQVFKERERISTPGRSEQGLPHYILFIAEEKYLDGEMFSKYIFNKKENYGLTVIWLVERREQLPNTCKLVLERSKEFSGWYEIERHSQKREEIHFDYIKKEAAERLIRTISGIRVAEIEEKRDIPDTIDFLKMYGVMTVKELDIESRWRQNSIYESCRVLIGKKAGGESCYLDIHERYHGPHKDGEDYAINLSVTDRAGNKSEWKDREYFTIDKTLPEVSIAIENNTDYEKENQLLYFNTDKTVVFCIKDKNFDEHKVEYDIRAIKAANKRKLIDADNTESYVINGEKHYKYLTLKEEAHYYIQMRCTDKAGNESEKKKIEFIIDKTVPNITIKGVKNEAVYEDRVIMPEVICEDKYLDADSVKVYLLKASGEPVSKEGWNYERTEDKRKVQIQWENLRQNKSKDGIYQLFIKANDKAGNKIKDNYKVVFRVNRWGADFILNHKIKESIDGHYLREEPNIILKERCVKQTKSRVIILKDNEERRTLQGEYVKECIIADKKSEKYGWYEKSYNIKKENFAEEGEYLVTIQEDSKEKKIHFVIDKTPPAVHISNLEKDIYEEEEHNFTIGIMDNYAFERMELYVEKSTIPLHKKKVQKFIIKPEDLDKNHMVNQKITEDTAYQTIHYIAWDKAGNKLDSNDNGDTRKCLVTTNKPVKEYYKNNPRSQIIMGIVIAATVFTSGCIAFYNRKKHR